jgi:NADH-quinone oxidoreductase subunit I
MGVFHKTYTGMKGLLSGLGLTLGYFLKPSKVITQQYPENRSTLKLPKRSRSRIELVRDPQSGLFTCLGCGVCVKACPNGSIEVVRGKDPVTKKNVLEKFVYHFERCTVCGLCVDSCRTEALTMGQGFENAVYDSSQLTVILNESAVASGEGCPASAPAQTPASATPPAPTQPPPPASSGGPAATDHPA